MMHFFFLHRGEIWTLTLEHMWLVGVSILLAVVVGFPLGILLTRRPRLRQPVLATVSVIQVIPSLALFGFLLPVPWLGERAARLTIVALMLYALLPLVRNTYVGISGVDATLRETARAMGLTDFQVLTRLELPLAISVILAGLRTATVICVGVATIAAAIGAGGLGELIFRGLAMVDNRLILAGAIPAAALALLADFVLGRIEAALRPTSARS
jgi:osmoprotectant transport system permease protein